MKAYWIAPGTSGTTVELRDTPAPEPKAGELLVRVRASSLNRGELLGGKPGAAAKPGGGECSGEVRGHAPDEPVHDEGREDPAAHDPGGGLQRVERASRDHARERDATIPPGRVT